MTTSVDLVPNPAFEDYGDSELQKKARTNKANYLTIFGKLKEVPKENASEIAKLAESLADAANGFQCYSRELQARGLHVYEVSVQEPA